LARVWCGALQYVAGFGIGTYTFRVLNWVIVIMVFGALYLKESVKGVRDEKHPFVWCLGASLSRLLPVIEINKEFTDFFNDPERKRLTGWQGFIFSVIGIVGWVLGLILLAAVSGLTQSS
jgi:small-conductance mechanosensitive channel